MSDLIKKLSEIQVKLKAPKNQFNKFGGYSYRSCEDILNAVKPYLEDGYVVKCEDEPIMIGDRIYIKATATFRNSEESESVTAYAREAENKKGMDCAQVTGAASSYARKYALNGLFCIDDTKDPDSHDRPDNAQKKSSVDYKKLHEQIEEVKGLLTKVTTGMSAEDKASFLYKFCNVKKFDDFKSKSNDDLELVKKALKEKLNGGAIKSVKDVSFKL